MQERLLKGQHRDIIGLRSRTLKKRLLKRPASTKLTKSKKHDVPLLVVEFFQVPNRLEVGEVLQHFVIQSGRPKKAKNSGSTSSPEN